MAILIILIVVLIGWFMFYVCRSIDHILGENIDLWSELARILEDNEMANDVKAHLKGTTEFLQRTDDELLVIYEAMANGDDATLLALRRYYQTIRDHPTQDNFIREKARFVCGIMDSFQVEQQTKGGTESWTETQS